MDEQLVAGSGYTRLNLATKLRVTQSDTKVWVFMNNNAAATMRDDGFMFINKLD